MRLKKIYAIPRIRIRCPLLACEFAIAFSGIRRRHSPSHTMKPLHFQLLNQAIRHRLPLQAHRQLVYSQRALARQSITAAGASFSTSARVDSSGHKSTNTKLSRWSILAAAAVAASTAFGFQASESEGLPDQHQPLPVKKKKESAMKLFCGNANHQLVAEVAQVC